MRSDSDELRALGINPGAMPSSTAETEQTFDERYPLDVPAVGKLLGVGDETVRRLVRSGALHGTRKGASSRAPLRFAQADVDAYIARRRV